jgi:nuclear pore complex protein Nup98-Nup96
MEGDVPRATVDTGFDFSQFAEEASLDTPAALHEHQVWELTKILYDDEMTVSKYISEGRGSISGVRKGKLSTFWKEIVRADAHADVSQAKSPEEKALYYLSGGMVEEACMALVEGRNFHLATLVAQIGGDQTFRRTISTQLESWRTLNVLSEFNEHIRAIYELLAGNTCLCQGKTRAGVENKLSDFSFSEQFHLDWRRAFGLRLWYGIEPSQTIEAAVEQFEDDLTSGIEKSNPVPWFIGQDIDMGWKDPNPDSRVDFLWSLLKMHTQMLLSDEIEAAFAPENVSGNPLDARLSFQMLHLLQSREVITLDKASTAPDTLAADFASAIATVIPSNPDALHLACWALLHLSEPTARVQSVRALLDQHAPLLVPGSKLFSDLSELRIPREWIHMSRALYARAVEHDPVAEAQNLMDAGEWEQAHEVLCRIIGPRAVIEQDSDQLRELLGPLEEKKEANRLAWSKGAGLYYDYVELKDLERQRGPKWRELAVRLAKSLEGVMSEGLKNRDLTERAALQIMGATVAEIAASGDVEGLQKAAALRLPLTEDTYLKQSKALSMDYFEALLAA